MTDLQSKRLTRYVSIIDKGKEKTCLIYGNRVYSHENKFAFAVYKGDLKEAISALTDEERKNGLEDAADWELKFLKFENKVPHFKNLVDEVVKQAKALGIDIKGT